MRKSTLVASSFLALMLAAGSAAAQGVTNGINQGASGINSGSASGASTGNSVAGPIGGAVGGVVGGVVGGTVGTVEGLLGINQQPRFKEYVVREKRPSTTFSGPLVVGTVVPSTGVTYYEVPPEYGQTTYRYTMFNNHAVLIDPKTNRIVQVID